MANASMKRSSAAPNTSIRQAAGKAKAKQKKRRSPEPAEKRNRSPRSDEAQGQDDAIRACSEEEVVQLCKSDCSSAKHGPEAPASAADAADPKLVRLLSPRSQTVLENASILNGWIAPPASSVWLLLRVEAGRRQGLLSAKQCEQLYQQLEDSNLECAQELLDDLGVRLEPGLPAEEQWECKICFCDQEEQGWRCPNGHRFCATCMRQHVDSVAFPRCPGEKCGHLLCEADFRALGVPEERLEAFLSAQLQRAIDELSGPASVKTGNSPEPDISEPSRVNLDQVANGTSAVAHDIVVRCTNRLCNNLMLLDRRAKKCQFACSCGATPFCSLCKEQPYHYHGECELLQAIRERWLRWLERDRYQYHMIERQSQEYGDIDDAAENIRHSMARRRQLERDEAWKEMHCRVCPRCQQPIEKTAGCDSMVCGQDAHGGNQQPGCGQHFAWSKAAPYVSPLPRLCQTAVKADDISNRGRNTLHAFINCDACGSNGNGILGPRFRCIHCPCYNICVSCEATAAISSHVEGHVFEILFEAEFAWSSIYLPLRTVVRTVRHRDLPPWGKDGPMGTAAVLAEDLEGWIQAVAQPPVEDKHRLRRRTDAWGYCVRFTPDDLREPEFDLEVPAIHLEPVLTSSAEAQELIQQTIREDAAHRHAAREARRQERLAARAKERCSDRLQAFREILVSDERTVFLPG